MCHTKLNQSFQKLRIEWISLYLLPVTQLVGLYGPGFFFFFLLLEDNLFWQNDDERMSSVVKKKDYKVGNFFSLPINILQCKWGRKEAKLHNHRMGHGGMLCQLWEATSSKICLAIDRTFLCDFFLFLCLPWEVMQWRGSSPQGHLALWSLKNFVKLAPKLPPDVTPQYRHMCKWYARAAVHQYVHEDMCWRRIMLVSRLILPFSYWVSHHGTAPAMWQSGCLYAVGTPPRGTSTWLQGYLWLDETRPLGKTWPFGR